MAKKNMHPDIAYDKIAEAIKSIDPKIVDVLDRKDAMSAIYDACYEVLWQDGMEDIDEVEGQ